MSKIILITGGARSGKSSYALNRAEEVSARRLFVATSPTVDSEMTERVRRHKDERKGRGWVTIESETDLVSIFRDQSNEFDVMLIDCITLWVNNILFAAEADANSRTASPPVDDNLIAELCNEWLTAARSFAGTVICVTNEVGLGIVPENALARQYRDLVGTCNQLIGRYAEEVVFVSCGVPLTIKKL